MEEKLKTDMPLTNIFLSYAALQFQFIPEVVSVLEGTSAVATVCIQSLNTVLQQDIVVVLQAQDGSAIGE